MWDGMYQSTPPWDTGRPQPALLAVAEQGGLHGRVLDVGCGTGEHTLMAASFGHEATGIDLSPVAVGMADGKVRERGVGSARFMTGDCLDLGALGEQWDTITDSSVFHIFSDEDRPRFVASLRSALVSGGRVVMLCFSDEEPPGWGPRRISKDEIREAFADGWRVETIEPATIELSGEGHPPEARGWLAIVRAQ